MTTTRNPNAKTARKSNYVALLLVRVSSTKQRQESDSPEIQVERGLACAKRRFNIGSDQVLVLSETYSGRAEERPQLDQALAMVQQFELKYLFFFDIDRLTRAGPAFYETTKRDFTAAGCQLIDVKGIIQPVQNSLEGTGGQLGDDFTYDWSVYAPSEKAEVMEAQAAKDEARKILGRTIPIQIRNVQLGRTNRPAAFGFRNCKIIDDTGKPQPSKEIDEQEAFFVRKLYSLKAAGIDNRNIADKLNQLGFRTRERKKWDKDHTRVIGMVGGRPATPERCQSMLERPVYAGFIVERWTHGLPVKANHVGLVSLETWNKANQGRYTIIADPTSQTGWRLKVIDDADQRRSYQYARPDFPFKPLLKCGECGKAPKACYSKSSSGNKFGYYFCARGHKTVSINSDKLEASLREQLASFRFTPEMSNRFEAHLRAVWAEKLGSLNQHLMQTENEIVALRDQADGIFERIKLASNALIIERLETEYVEIDQQIKALKSNRKNQEIKEEDIQEIIKWGRHLVEHLDELIFDTCDERLRAIFWRLLFVQTPSIEDVKSRTLPISPLVQSVASSNNQKSSLVDQTGFRSNSQYLELIRWAKQLAGHFFTQPGINRHKSDLVEYSRH